MHMQPAIDQFIAHEKPTWYEIYYIIVYTTTKLLLLIKLDRILLTRDYGLTTYLTYWVGLSKILARAWVPYVNLSRVSWRV